MSGVFFPTNLDLANILGRTDLDFENFNFLHFLGIPKSGKPGRAWAGLGLAGPGLGQAWAGLLGPLRLGPGLSPFLGPGLGWALGRATWCATLSTGLLLAGCSAH